MSFDIWISAFQNEEQTWFPTKELLRRFDGYTTDETKDEFRFQVGGDRTLCKVWYEDKNGMVDGFAISRPTGHPELWAIVAGFLRDLPCVLYWPSTTHRAAMGSLDLLPHLPASFVEACGIPFVSTDAETIRKFVGANS